MPNADRGAGDGANADPSPVVRSLPTTAHPDVRDAVDGPWTAKPGTAKQPSTGPAVSGPPARRRCATCGGLLEAAPNSAADHVLCRRCGAGGSVVRAVGRCRLVGPAFQPARFNLRGPTPVVLADGGDRSGTGNRDPSRDPEATEPSRGDGSTATESRDGDAEWATDGGHRGPDLATTVEQLSLAIADDNWSRAEDACLHLLGLLRRRQAADAAGSPGSDETGFRAAGDGEGTGDAPSHTEDSES